MRRDTERKSVGKRRGNVEPGYEDRADQVSPEGSTEGSEARLWGA